MITLQHFTFSPFAENTYVLYDETKEAVIIDPGCHTAQEQTQLQTFIERKQLQVVKLLNTHCHLDHVFGNQFIKETFGVKLYMHQKDLPTLKAAKIAAEMYGIRPFVESEADEFLEEGEQVSFGNSQMDILFVPGHAPGHIAFVVPEQKFVLSGDVLFRQSIGRTDFPGCSYEQLMDSIRSKILPLGDDFTVYSGHGPETTIGFEKQHNPFLN